MSDIVNQIHGKILSIAGANLPSDYQLMRRVFRPETNDLRSSHKAYGALHLSAFAADGVTKFYTLNHEFQTLLMHNFADQMDDSVIQDTINDLYDVADDLLKVYFASKLELPLIVLVVNNPSIGQPEILENKTVLLRLGFNVQYRSQIT